MTPTAKPETLWSKRGFGCVSMGVSAIEIFVMWGTAALVQISKEPHASSLQLNIVGITYLVGGLGSFGFAIAGLFADSHRATAFIGLLAAVITFLVCGLLMLV